MKLLAALKGENRGRPPLWLMRQAGRYLPEYRKLREKYDFLTLCRTPELIYEVTMQPIERFGFDASIVFSDILLIPDRFGLNLRFEEARGPLFEKTIQTPNDIEQLPSPEPLSFVAEGIRLLKKTLPCPLIGFAGAPFTTASYMIEGGSSPTLRLTKKWLFHHPTAFHTLLRKLTAATLSHLQLQIEAGVDAIQLFDSWAGCLAHAQFKEFCLDYLHEIQAALPPHIPLIYFCKGQFPFTHLSTPLSIGSSLPLSFVRKHVSVPLQGNLDPEILLAPREKVVQETKKLLNEFGHDPGWIFNLGHGILPETPLENVYGLVETIAAGTAEAETAGTFS